MVSPRSGYLGNSLLVYEGPDSHLQQKAFTFGLSTSVKKF